jgi:hypothetical protein
VPTGRWSVTRSPTIIGAHSIIYRTNVDADRASLRAVLRFPHVDVGGGWLSHRQEAYTVGRAGRFA